MPTVPPSTSRPDYVLVGGVPGAGKSTALAAAAPDLVDVTVLDPEAVRARLRTQLPALLPYGWYRPVVHLVHLVIHAWFLLRGPQAGRLLVHDPSTRRSRLRALHRLAVLRGWTPLLVYVDTDPIVARAGQVARARVVHGRRFEAHCRRWSQLREDAASGSCHGWSTRMCTRDDAADTLRMALAGQLRPTGSVLGVSGVTDGLRSASVR